MNLRYLFLIITLKGIHCYNPKRHITQASSTSSFKNLKSKSPDPVIPARYKITSTMNYEDPSPQSFPAEFFPEVEYPKSIVDSSKPFYISSSPFSNDVKSTFNSLVAKSSSKAKTSTDYSWALNEKSKDKLPATLQKVGANEITDTKGNEINACDKSTNETLCEDIGILDVKDDATVDEIPFSDSDMGEIFNNKTSTEQSAELQDKDYVEEFFNDLEEVMKNLTKLETPECNEGENNTVHTFESEEKVMKNLTNSETPECNEGNNNTVHTLSEEKVMKNLTNSETPECNEGNNNTVHTFDSECSDEFKLSSDMMPNNNDTFIELNEDSSPEEEHPEPIRNPLFEDSDTNDALTNLTSILNEYIMKNDTSVEDMQSDFYSTWPIANETDTSCSES